MITRLQGCQNTYTFFLQLCCPGQMKSSSSLFATRNDIYWNVSQLLIKQNIYMNYTVWRLNEISLKLFSLYQIVKKRPFCI